MEDRSPAEAEATTRSSSRKHSPFRRWVTGGMLGLALGAMLLGGTAFAQPDTEGTDLGQSFIDRLAERLGMTTDELEATIEETQRDVVDQAVADGRLTEEQGEALKARIASGDGFTRLMPGHRQGIGMHAFPHLDIDLATIAAELGTTTEELRDELAAGATLSEAITERGSTVEDVVAALVADAETKLAEAVANGNLTQEQADQILANLPERLTRVIEMDDALDCKRWFSGGDEPTEDTDAEETSSQV